MSDLRSRLYWIRRDLMHPIRICHLIGHRRESYIGRHVLTRRGHLRPIHYSRCIRCGTSDGGEVYREGLLERLHWRRIRGAWWRLRTSRRVICHDCGKPERRWWRSVGDHRGCIPF